MNFPVYCITFMQIRQAGFPQPGKALLTMSEASLPTAVNAVSPASTAAEGYFCRVGHHGQVGRFHAAGTTPFSRGQTVVLRTARGVELGTILAPRLGASPASNPGSAWPSSADGTILRPASTEDRWLQQSLEAAAHQAFHACQAFLTAHDYPDVLLDVEPLLDARTLYFYFVGTPTLELRPQLEQLASIFHETVRQSLSARQLDEGCGPGCGTSTAAGCGSSGGCSVCVVAQACGQASRN